MKAFTKGEKVTLIKDWDQMGTFCYVHAIVESCGSKVMVLINEASGECMGRHFKAVENMHNDFSVIKRVTDAEAESLCLSRAAVYIASCPTRAATMHEPRALKG